MSLGSDKWQEISTLFDEALELPQDERDRYLRATSDDSKVIRKVLRMLAAEDSNVRFLDGPIDAIAPDLILDSVASTPRTRVGNYQLVEEIGRGGMGAVYRAVRDDGEFDHVAAVKLMKAGAASIDLRRRFLAERQILASLSHPNIARLLDGGATEDGESYLVMEYVEGAPITTFCDENHCSIEQRLRLLIDVCHAVSHAHRNLVVHRDLKPSNIFVTSGGQVKLLDFGIAKLLIAGQDVTGGFPETSTGLHLLTPEYATPEQVRGEPITTASDIYQVGLLMYELLTGAHPYRFTTRSLTELAHTVCDAVPARPSSVELTGNGGPAGVTKGRVWRAALRGDLDVIILKALRKDPSDRYASIDKLAEDLVAHLEGRPVASRDGTTIYRLRKFARRHRWKVTATGAFFVLLTGYAVTVTVQQKRTAKERDRAENYAAFLTELLASPDPFGIEAEVDQREVTVQSFLDRSVEKIRTDFAREPRLQVDLLGTVGEVYRNLGLTQKAGPVLEEALDLAIVQGGWEDPAVVDLMRRLAESTDDPARADSLHREQIALARRIEAHPGPETFKSLTAYGAHLFEVDRWVEADSVLTEALLIRPVDLDPMTLALALYDGGRTNRVLDRLERADSLLTISSDLIERTLGPDHPYTAMVKTELAAVIEFEGEGRDAERLRREALEVFEATLGRDHPTTIQALGDLAILLSKLGRHDEAETIMRQILDLHTSRHGGTHHQTINALQNLATFLMKQGKLEEAEPLFQSVSSRYAGSLPSNHHLHAFPQLSLTEIHLRRRHYEKARQTATSALARLEAGFPGGHPLLAVAQSRLGAALTGLNRYAEAEESLLRAIDDLAAAEGFKPFLETTQQRLIELYRAWGRPSEADSVLHRYSSLNDRRR